MRLISNLGFAICGSSILFLTGCQHLNQPHKTIVSSQIQDENHFYLQGKIGVHTPYQSGSAFFTWIQRPDQFNIELSGALGIGKTQIKGQSGQVTLTSAKTGEITATSAEELLEKATGWHAPVQYLTYWVQAKPATSKAKIQMDQDQRIQHLTEAGWNVDFSYPNAQHLPNKLVIKQVLADDQENRITMVIQNREFR